MKKYLVVCAAAICLNGVSASLHAVSVRGPGVDLDVSGPYGYYYFYDNPSYQAWAGPGWYYGIWFEDADDYYYWLSNNFYDSYWSGPGWYYGVYFYDEPQFNDYRRYHRFHGRTYSGNPAYHKKKNRGKWDSKEHRKYEDSARD